jgi:hypothetical protein
MLGGLGGYEEFLEPGMILNIRNMKLCAMGRKQHYREFDISFRNNLLKTCLKIKKVK